jgi:hypothetical protein
MSIVAPKGRKHLSADALLRLVRSGFDHIAAHRGGDAEIPLTDALMSACAMFSLKSPSLLAFDKQRAEGNLHSIYGIKRVPCDTLMRESLDPVSPESLRPVFKSILRQLQRGKALEALVFLDGHYLVALEGTGYFSSHTIPWASCLQKVHRNGTITYAHQMLGAALSHPDVREVLPLMPAPIVTQDGTSKNDGERHAAKRFIAKLRQDHPHLKFIVTADRLSANAPTSRPYQTTVCTISWVSQKAIMPCCSRRGRQRRRRGVSPRMSGTTVPQVLGLAFGLSTTCRSMPRMRTCGSMSSRTGRWGLTRCNTSVG